MATLDTSTRIQYLPPVNHGRSTANKNVIFYINGDIFHKGHLMVITPKRFRNSFSVLLDELTRILTMRGSTGAGIRNGVRYILRLSGEPLYTLEQLEDGQAYVCSSFKRLERLNYGHLSGSPEWKATKSIVHPAKVEPVYFGDRESLTLAERKKANKLPQGQHSANMQPKNLKPRIIKVVRNGHERPRRVIKVLLNKRTAQTIDQILNEITSSVGTYGGGSVVRRLYDTRGQQVLRISDLFKDEDVFIAVGFERFRVGDIGDILNELENPQKPQPQRYPRATEHEQHKYKRIHHVKEESASKQNIESMAENKQRQQGDKISSNSSTPRSVHSSLKHNQSVGNNHLPKITQNGNLPNASVQKDIKKQQQRDVKKTEPKPLPSSNTPQYQISMKTHEHRETVKSTSVDGGVKLPSIGNVHNIVSVPTQKSVSGSKKDFSQNNDSKLDQENRPAQNKVLSKKESKKKLTENKNIYSDTVNSRDEEKKKTDTQPSEKTLPLKPQRVEDVYEFGRKIGDGNFAVVRIVSHRLTKRDYAVKIIDKRKIKGKEKMIQNEIEIMRKCSHPNIVRLYEDFDSATDIYLVMELVKGGDLFDAISGSVKFAEKLARTYVRDMCKALHYLHKQMIVHRDMKPENLMVYKRTDGSTLLKLADFGLAMKVEAPIFTICGTPTYVAPEILDEHGYELKVDMWATGVITYIMLCGFPPFRSANRDQEELFDMIQEGDYEFVSPYWDSVSDNAKDLVSSLLVVEPKKRYSAHEVLQHPWVRMAGGARGEILDSPRNEEAKRKFKAAAIAVQSVKKFENLVEEFHHRRGEKLLV